MKEKSKEKIGTREFFAVIALMIGIKISDTTSAILSQAGKNATWMIPIVAFLTFLPSFLLLLRLLNHYQNKHLIELIQHLLGKYIGFLVGFIIFMIVFLALAIDSRNYIDTLTTMYFPASPNLGVYFIFIGGCFFIAKRGLESIASTAWLLVPYIKIVMFILILFLLNQVIWLRVFPLLGWGPLTVLKEGVQKAAIFGDLFILTILFTTVKDTKIFKKVSIFGGIFTCIEIVVFFLLYCLLFDYESIDKVAYPFHEVTRYIALGQFFTNIETFFLPFWLLASLVRFSLYLYFTTWIFGAIIKLKEFEPLLLSFGFLAVGFGVLPENPIINALIYREQLLMYSSIIFIGLPYLLWITAKVKGELKK
jgi:spore germination protein KB